MSMWQYSSDFLLSINSKIDIYYQDNHEKHLFLPALPFPNCSSSQSSQFGEQNHGPHTLYFFFNFFLTFLLEYNCFTMVCQFLLYNKVNQLFIYIYSHTSSLLRLPPFQLVTKHRVDLPVLCNCFRLAIYFTFGTVYMSIYTLPLSDFVPAYPSTSPCPQVHSLVGLCLYSHLAPRFFMITFFFLDFRFFRFHIYVLTYGICFSLSDLLHSV